MVRQPRSRSPHTAFQKPHNTQHARRLLGPGHETTRISGEDVGGRGGGGRDGMGMLITLKE